MEDQRVDDNYIKKAWNENADQYFGLSERSFDLKYIVLPALTRLAGDVHGLNGLDAGCGAGDIALFLLDRGANMWGIDLADRLVEIASSRNPDGEIKFQTGNIKSMPMFRNGQFDFIICHCVLFDVLEMENAYAELGRVLKEGGFLIVSVMHPCFWSPRRTWVEMPNGKSESASKRARVVEDYLTPRNTLSLYIPPEIAKSRYPTITFNRRLADLVNAALTNQLDLVQIDEPEPTEEGIKRMGEAFWMNKLKVPDYLFLKLKKR